MVVFHALGQCIIRTAITTITPRADMGFALGAYLIGERGKRVSRTLLIKLFWPGATGCSASHKLSEALHKLRRKGLPVCGDDMLCVWLPRDAVSFDIDTLHTAEPHTLPERDLTLLPGYMPAALPDFHDWIDAWRGRMQLRVIDDLVSAIGRAEAQHDWRSVMGIADQILKLDPDNETALLASSEAAHRLRVRGRTGSAASSGERVPAAARAAAVRERTDGSARRAVASSTSNVPRDVTSDLARLFENGDLVVGGSSAAECILGSAGAGKTRSLAQLEQFMRERGAVTCSVACTIRDTEQPLSVIGRVLDELRDQPGAAGCSPRELQLLEQVIHGEFGSRRAAASDVLRMAVLDLIGAVSEEQPLSLAIDDVHLIDPASWSLLRFVAEAALPSVMVVCAARGDWNANERGDPGVFAIRRLRDLSNHIPRAEVTPRETVGVSGAGGQRLASALHLAELGLYSDAANSCEAVLSECRTPSDRKQTLTALAEVLHAGGKWEQLCGTIAQLRQLRQQAGHSACSHDQLELWELNAKWQLYHDWPEVIEHAMACAFDTGLDPAHRIAAAVTGLKLASNLGDFAAMKRIHAAVSDLDSKSVGCDDKLMVELIYHTICGDPARAGSIARGLLGRIGTNESVGELTLLANCASALRRSADPVEVRGLYARMFVRSAELRAFELTARACHAIIEVCMDSGAFEVAKRWAETYGALKRPESEVWTHRNLRLACARVAVHFDELDHAARLLGHGGRDRLSAVDAAMFRAGALATEVRLAIRMGETCARVTELVNRLAPLSVRFRGIGTHDYETFSLVLGLKYIGRLGEANTLLRRYSRTERRDLTGLSPEIEEYLAATRQRASLAKRAAVAGLPACAEAIGVQRA